MRGVERLYTVRWLDGARVARVVSFVSCFDKGRLKNTNQSGSCVSTTQHDVKKEGQPAQTASALDQLNATSAVRADPDDAFPFFFASQDLYSAYF
jgi:hypothetical protein